MTNIIETSFGALADPKRIALGSASPVRKKGAFYNFSLRIDNNDLREYSFTNYERAENMRKILISHLEEKIKKELKSMGSSKC